MGVGEVYASRRAGCVFATFTYGCFFYFGIDREVGLPGVSWWKRQGYVSVAAIVIFFIIFSGWIVFEKCFLADDGNGF